MGYAKISNFRLAGATLCLVLISTFQTFSLPQAGENAAALREEDRILHVLNRLGFGPRPGDLKKVQSMGVEAYIHQQLYPEQIPDPAIDSVLGRFRTLEMTSGDLTQLFVKVRQDRRALQQKRGERQETSGTDGRDRARMEPEELEDPNIRKMSEASMQSMRSMRQVQFELMGAKLLRAVYSTRQLQEILVDFWTNHFNIFMGKGLDQVLTTHFEHNAIRPHALGKFEDLLEATAKNPAMLFYLDNWISSAPAEVMEDRISELGKGRSRAFRRQPAASASMPGNAMRFLRRAKGLNENYARELMELHTLGVDGGYTQQDVSEVARAFTGWTINPPGSDASFRFEPLLHEEGDKVVLGRTIKSSGVHEGEEIIRILANHPSTARFISWKLARRFVADDPPEELVQAATHTFLQTGGDIRRTLGAIFSHPKFFSREVYQAKIKRPFEFVVSALRASDARVRPVPFFMHTLREMGEAPYLCPEPTGYPDVASAWLNTNFLLKRVNFALDLANGRVPRTEVDLDAAQALLAKLGLPEPEGENQKTQVALLLGSPAFQKK